MQIRPFDMASPWNTPIQANPIIDARSAQYIAAVADNNLPLTCDPDQYTIPVYEVSSATPLVKVVGAGYYSTYDNGDASRVGHGSPWTQMLPIPPGAVAGDGSDGQISLWDPVAGLLWEIWQLEAIGDGSYTAANAWRYHTGPGYMGRMADGKAGRGAGTPYLAGLVRSWEVTQGRIDHALAFAYASPAHQFVYPAGKTDGAGKVGVDMPEGARLQLDPAYDVTQLPLGAAQVIAKALQRYGAFVVDNSGSSKVYLEHRRTAGWGSAVTRSILSSIPWSAFRVVQT